MKRETIYSNDTVIGFSKPSFWSIKKVLFIMAVIIIAFASKAETVTIDPSITYNTMNGWETTPIWEDVASDGFYTPKLIPFQDQIADFAVNQLGLNRVRLEIGSGNENTIDYWAQFFNGQITRTTLKEHLYQKINDNADPNVSNPNGFHFTSIDYQIDHIVLPMMQKLAANGESLYLSLNVVDFNNGTNGMVSDFSIANDPDEYAELIHETFKHLDSKYGITPNALEIILEPDNSTDWKGVGIGTRIGNNLVAAVNRLNNNGFALQEVIAPSTLSSANAISAFDEMIQIPGVLGLIDTISYHKYSGNTNANRPQIYARAVANGLKTAMLENFTDTHIHLMDDLQQAHISSYQRWAYAAPHFSTYIKPDFSDPNNPGFRLHDQVRAMPQVFKYVRFNALQIGVISGNGAAYINQNGSYAVIIENSGTGPHSVIGLPAGNYGIISSGTNASSIYLFEAVSPDVTIVNGETLSFNVPTSGGLITVFSKIPQIPDTQAPSIPNNLQGTAISDNSIDLVWDASTDNISVAGYRIYRDGNEISTTIGTIYRDMGLVELSQYDYSVSAYDFAGNESNQSNPISITTLARINQLPIADAGLDQSIVDIDDNGSELITLDASASNDPDGSLVGYVWKEAGIQLAIGQSPTVNLFIGVHTLELTVTDNDGAIATDLVIVSILDPANTVHIWLEAESANPITAPMQILTDPNASIGQYISNTNGGNSYGAPPTNGRATYNFNVPINGNYKIWGRLIAPVDFQDSFWVNVDDGNWMTWAVQIGSTWFWDDVQDFGQSPMIYPLTSGNHTLIIAYREENTKLDKLFITNDGTIPTGLGGNVSDVIYSNGFE